MKIKQLLLASVFLMSIGLNAQVNTGTISGVIYEAEDSITVIPFARVWVETESGKRQALANENGYYKIDALKSGIYNLKVKSLGFDSLTISGIDVGSGISTANAYCGTNNLLPPFIVYTPPIIHKDIPIVRLERRDIAHSPDIRNPLKLIGNSTSDIKIEEGSNDVIIRGSRPGDAIFYIDGVKSTSMSSIPGAAIGGMEAYTGGIPAKYGDTTGGVIVLETQSYFDLYNAWLYR